MRPHQPFVELAWFIAEAADVLSVKLRRLGVLPNDFFIKLFADRRIWLNLSAPDVSVKLTKTARERKPQDLAARSIDA
jgi:hypothetical protein